MEKEHKEKEGRIIRDGHFLSEEYLPEKVVGRVGQKQKLLMCLSPMKDGHTPLNAWLHGPTGSGKTVLARTITMEICEDTSAGFVFHVNCWERRSLFSVVQAIADSLKVLGADAQDTNVKLSRIRRVTKEKPVVVILDDVDRVAPSERDRIIYALLGMQNAGVICVSSRKETLLSLEERTKSRLSPLVISFPPYRKGELEEILHQRARDSFRPDTWDAKNLSRLALSSNGDARIAIQALRQSAIVADNDKGNHLAANVSPSILFQFQKTRHEKTSAGLSYHEGLLYELATKYEPIQTMNLWKLYSKHCQKKSIQPIARRTFSKYVRHLGDRGFLSLDFRTAPQKGRLIRASPALPKHIS